MITPEYLAPLWAAHPDALAAPVRDLDFPAFGVRFTDKPYQLGVLNLSKDSNYRETVCPTLDHALYRARRMRLEGAPLIYIGAEATAAHADIINAQGQTSLLLPVVEALTAEGIMTSIDTYLPEVAEACLKAGAPVINITGRIDDPDFYLLVASHGAGVILCYTPGKTNRDQAALPAAEDIVTAQMDYFRETLERVTKAGVERIWLDPGFGFFLNLPDGADRLRYQTESILGAFRFRVFGWPVCVTLPSSVFLFRDEVRCAETCYGTLAVLAKANLIRSHEVARVQPVLDILEYSQ